MFDHLREPKERGLDCGISLSLSGPIIAELAINFTDYS